MACVIKPYAEISIGTPVEGLIQTVPVDRGDWVTKGQVIVTLESSLEEATVALAKAKAEAEAALKSSQVKIGFSTRKLERALDLFKTNSIAQHDVDEAQTEKALAEISYQEASENKRQAELELNRATAALYSAHDSEPDQWRGGGSTALSRRVGPSNARDEAGAD